MLFSMPREFAVDLLEQVAAAKNVDILTLPPLAESIDPELVERLCDCPSEAVGLHFTYAECEVTITGGGDPDVEVAA